MSGNALHKIFAFIHPHVKHVVTMSCEIAADEVDAGAPSLSNNPTLHLRHQAVRISQGKPVDCVTALLLDEVCRGEEGTGLPRSQEP
jgi:hypothetical protein